MHLCSEGRPTNQGQLALGWRQGRVWIFSCAGCGCHCLKRSGFLLFEGLADKAFATQLFTGSCVDVLHQLLIPEEATMTEFAFRKSPH